MFKRAQPPDPLAEGFAAIDDVWGANGWYLTAVEQDLRADPDTLYHDRKREQARAIAEARRSELRAALLARSQPR